VRVEWLAYRAKIQQHRARETTPCGAHAFVPGESRSLCRIIDGTGTTGPADDSARKCCNCLKEIERIQRRHDVAASVARHAGLEEP
jgi:hypothetical protein